MNSSAIIKLLTPSWLVSVIAVSFGILMTAGTIVLQHYRGSQLQQELFNANLSASVGASTGTTYQAVMANIAGNRFLSDLPLILVWACVGLAVYYLTMSIVRSFERAAQIQQETQYVHTNRRAILQESLGRTAVRIVGMVAWVAATKLSLLVLIPYALAAASSASRIVSVDTALYVILALIVLYVVVYAQAVAVRLIMLRPRLFGE